MNIIKNIPILALVGLIFWLVIDNNSEQNDTPATVAELSADEPVKIKPLVRQPPATKEEAEHQPLLQQLQPPNDVVLEDVWLEEYGCAGGKALQACAFDFLNAESYQEALWMKNNGYPTLSMIELVKDPQMYGLIKAMAEDQHPAAMAIITIEAMERGDFKEASMLALTNLAYADEANVYAHNLYGEALLGNNMKITAVKRFYVAGLLGDHKAQKRASDLSPDLPFASSALKGAHYYLEKVFGNSIPYDPRPKSNEEG